MPQQKDMQKCPADLRFTIAFMIELLRRLVRAGGHAWYQAVADRDGKIDAAPAGRSQGMLIHTERCGCYLSLDYSE
jgi:hypothetical protein